MDLSQLVYEMSHNVLSNADIKAICKSRGFSDKVANSRSLFENTFLSSTGLETVIKTLTPAEVAALHLLYRENRLVDVSFFERLYANGNRKSGSFYGTFTQQYKPVFDNVQNQLVRKGLLVISEAKTSASGKAKMELWRYAFPEEFGPYLPPLLSPAVRTTETGKVKSDQVRTELEVLVQNPKGYSGLMGLHEGRLRIGNQPFSVRAVQKWQQEKWGLELRRPGVQFFYTSNIYQGFILTDGAYPDSSPLPFVQYAFSQLKPEEWVAPEQLDTLLNVFYNTPEHPTSIIICRGGYDTGCLARYSTNDKNYYRLPDARHLPLEVPPQEFLKVEPEGEVEILVRKVPYSALEVLNQSVYLVAENGTLRARPDLNRLADAPGEVRRHPLLEYLKKQSKIFAAMFEKFERDWGKLIVHDNLLVARVTDLELKLQLQRAFGTDPDNPGGSLVLLAGDYIAFPRFMLAEIEKQVKKAGHIVKTVQAK
jgi:hypothetical protein